MSHPRPLLLAGALALLVLPACSNPTAEACNVPDEELSGFEITITTGDVATDADIFLCVERYSDANRDCTRLDEVGVDDWDVGSIGTYRVMSTVAAGDLAGIVLENRGDAPDLSFDGNSWELEAVRLVGQTATRGVLIFEEARLSRDLDAGDRYRLGCMF